MHPSAGLPDTLHDDGTSVELRYEHCMTPWSSLPLYPTGFPNAALFLSRINRGVSTARGRHLSWSLQHNTLKTAVQVFENLALVSLLSKH